jgi:hypothetical protein
VTAPVVDPYVTSLSRVLSDTQLELETADLYYRGQQPLQFLSPEVRRQVGNRLTSLVINWARVIPDSVARRLHVDGFRLGAGGAADRELWRIWQANDLDEWSQLAHLDALVHGRAFLSVWGNDTDPLTPRIRVESAHQVAVEYDPETNDVRAALKRWSDNGWEYATLYLPDVIFRYAAESPSSTVSGTSAGRNLPWVLRADPQPNPLGAVPIVPLINRPRVLDRTGESELTDVIPLVDAINKLATDMMVTSEFHATKRRYATGIQIATGGADTSEPERRRLQAEAAAYWDQATKGKTWLAGPGVQFGEFQEAGLDNFAGAIRLLTAQIAAISGLPPDDLGLPTVNPSSAEARRAAETVLVNRAREKMRAWGGAYEKAMRLALAVQRQTRVDLLPDELAGMETIWRDPQTPAIAQSTDAAVKAHAEGIIDDEQAQEDLGYSPVQRQAIAARAAEKAAAAATADVRARMDQARQLEAEGLSLNAALAAVGLLQAAAINSAESSATPPTAAGAPAT